MIAATTSVWILIIAVFGPTNIADSALLVREYPTQAACEEARATIPTPPNAPFQLKMCVPK